MLANYPMIRPFYEPATRQPRRWRTRPATPEHRLIVPIRSYSAPALTGASAREAVTNSASTPLICHNAGAVESAASAARAGVMAPKPMPKKTTKV